jgi:hypothetical protein
MRNTLLGRKLSRHPREQIDSLKEYKSRRAHTQQEVSYSPDGEQAEKNAQYSSDGRDNRKQMVSSKRGMRTICLNKPQTKGIGREQK